MVEDCLAARQDRAEPPKLVFSSNGQGLSLLRRQRDFRSAMLAADIVHADGMSVVMASRVGNRVALPERIATTDFFHDAAAEAVRHGLKFYFLGSSDSQNARAVESAKALYPGLQIVGCRDGFFADSDSEAVCREVVQSGADVLWLALGKPKQELWAVANRHRLAGVGWIKTCGGLFAFLSGDAKRAPRWMQRCGLEWFHRLMQEPLRLGSRYLVTNLHAAWILLRS